MEIKGTIKAVEKKIGDTNGKSWTRWTFEMVDGKKYATFNADVGEAFVAGQNVVVVGDQGDKYFKVQGMFVDENAPKQEVLPEVKDGPRKGNRTPEEMAAKDLTKIAVAHSANSNLPIEGARDEVWNTYVHYLDCLVDKE